MQFLNYVVSEVHFWLLLSDSAAVVLHLQASSLASLYLLLKPMTEASFLVWKCRWGK